MCSQQCMEKTHNCHDIQVSSVFPGRSKGAVSEACWERYSERTLPKIVWGLSLDSLH